MRTYVGEWQWLDEDERERLAASIDELLSTKSWEAAKGFDLTDEMCTVIAAHAALLVLGRDLSLYRHVRAVVVHPTTIVLTGPAPRRGGMMSDAPRHLLGEAHHHHGPVLLAWDSVRRESRHWRNGRNVAAHEFAHKIDMVDGIVDGTPPDLDDASRQRWVDVCTPVYQRLRREPHPALDDYAATDPGEFFAVASELFVTRPELLLATEPALYGALSDWYRRDPAARRPPPVEPA